MPMEPRMMCLTGEIEWAAPYRNRINRSTAVQTANFSQLRTNCSDGRGRSCQMKKTTDRNLPYCGRTFNLISISLYVSHQIERAC